MASPKYVTKQYLSHDFVIAAGCVLFRKSIESAELQVCLLYHRVRKEWLLPKGRKDCGESVEKAAIRETFEETGYPCELLPIRMSTRAVEVGSNTRDIARVLDDITEPLALTIREEEKGIKTIWWYVARVTGSKVEGTQTDTESFDSHFVDVDLAVERLTFQDQREVASKAIDIVNNSPELDLGNH